MSLLDRIRALVSGPPHLGGVGRDDEEAEREEYELPDRGEEELRNVDETGGLRGGGFAGGEAAEAAEEDLETFRPPPDPAP